MKHDKMKFKNACADVDKVFVLINETLKDYSPNLYLFGSRAKQREQKTSDIDIAILTEKTLPLHKLSEVREKIEQSKVIYTVDLVDLARIAPKFREKILKEGVLWNV